MIQQLEPVYADPYIQAVVEREEIRELKLRAQSDDEYMFLHDQESEVIYEQMFWEPINFYSEDYVQEVTSLE